MTRKKYAWILVTLILCGFMTTGWISYNVAHTTFEKQIQTDSLPLTSDNIYSEIQQDLIRPIFISSLMAQDTFVRDWTLSGEKSPEKIIQYLNEIKKQYGTVTSFYVSEATRNYYHNSGILKQVSEHDSQDAWYFRVRSQDPGKDFEVNIDHDTANLSNIVVFVNYRVYDFQHRFIGVIGVGLSSSAVAALIEKYKKRYNREIYFIDDSGQVTLRGDDDLGFTSIQEHPGLRELSTQILTTPSMTGRYESEGEQVYVSSRWVDEFQWYIMVQQKDRFDRSIFMQALLSNLAISLLVAVTVVYISHLCFRGYQSRLEHMATTDKLTGTYNRQAFDEIAVRLVQEASSQAQPLSLAIIDIDHFKEINDNYGHQIGDYTLQRVVSETQRLLANNGILCRWGGEEFIIFLPGANRDRAYLLMEEVRQSIAHYQMKPPVTISIGVAEYSVHESIDSVVARADKAMYKSKKNGRNQVNVG